MKRSALEHLIRAAGAIANDPEIVIIGSQSILGQYPNAPGVLSVSAEADLYPLHRPELAELIDGAIGEGSSFHEEFGYYAQGVDERTATMPKGWRERLIRIQNENTGASAGLCLEVHDLAISKYVAGREKDRGFTRELARQGFTQKPVLTERLAETELPDALRPIVRGRIRRDFA
jgi:uncharacterized nucleotidyltransferase DUF6036